MNIDELTLGQAKELAGLFSVKAESNKSFLDEFIGQYVICRSRNEGVNAGVVPL